MNSRNPIDFHLKLSERLGQKRTNDRFVDTLTEAVLLVEKELKRSLNEEQIAGIVDFILRKSK